MSLLGSGLLFWIAATAALVSAREQAQPHSPTTVASRTDAEPSLPVIDTELAATRETAATRHATDMHETVDSGESHRLLLSFPPTSDTSLLRTFPVSRLDEHLSNEERNRRRALYRQRRDRRLQSVPAHSRRLAGYKEHAQISREPDGVYYTWVRIGTSEADGGGKAFTLITDTGSSTIAVPCQGCDCGRHNHFVPSASQTMRDLGRRYSQCYGEGSCNSGKLLMDNMCFGNKCQISESVKMRFGCCTTFAPSFKDQEADGIIGLGHSNTLVKALDENGDLLAHTFSLCLGEDKGRLTVGGYDTDYHAEPLAWTPYIGGGLFYSINIPTMNVGDKSLSVDWRPIVDSGTTYSFVTSSVFNKMRNAFVASCNTQKYKCSANSHLNPPGTNQEDVRTSLGCWKLDVHSDGRLTGKGLAQLASYPPIEFKLKGGFMACIPPEQYFFLSDNNIHCIGINKDPQDVIGANLMVDFDVVFDQKNLKMGWARAFCDKPGSALPTCGSFAKKQVKITPSSSTSSHTSTPAPLLAPSPLPVPTVSSSPTPSPVANSPTLPSSSTSSTTIPSTNPAPAAPPSSDENEKHPSVPANTVKNSSPSSGSSSSSSSSASSSSTPPNSVDTSTSSTSADSPASASGTPTPVSIGVDYVVAFASITAICLAPLIVGLSFLLLPKCCTCCGEGPLRDTKNSGYATVGSSLDAENLDEEDSLPGFQDEPELSGSDLETIRKLSLYRDNLERDEDESGSFNSDEGKV